MHSSTPDGRPTRIDRCALVLLATFERIAIFRNTFVHLPKNQPSLRAEKFPFHHFLYDSKHVRVQRSIIKHYRTICFSLSCLRLRFRLSVRQLVTLAACTIRNYSIIPTFEIIILRSIEDLTIEFELKFKILKKKETIRENFHFF